jgi:hypothetical protein
VRSKRRRNGNSVFGLSFLDVMFCGFGSVLLLVMIVNADTLSRRKEVHQDLRGEVTRLETEVTTGEDYLAALRNDMDEAARRIVEARGRSRQVVDDTAQIEIATAARRQQTRAEREHVKRLQADLKTLEQERSRVAAQRERDKERGARVRRFLGEGDRQYLTGLRMGGRRVLILVDGSASMLDRTIVNIIRLRNMPDALKRGARKWRRTTRSVDWLLAQLPSGSQFQVYVFNTKAQAMVAGSDGRWLSTADRGALDQAAAGLRDWVPQGGTSLYNAFEVIRALDPVPDNVFLLTDGLPTQGSAASGDSKVSGERRLSLFRRARERVPKGVPVNTILFPIEGDPFASSEFWKLAVATAGSFLAPARDWP